MDKLPTPATQQDMYAYATVIELRRLNDNLKRLVGIVDQITWMPDTTGEEVALKEPEPAKKPTNRDAKKAAAKDK